MRPTISKKGRKPRTPSNLEKLLSISRRLRFLAFVGFVFSSLLWCFTTLAEFGVLYGKYQFYVEPNSLVFGQNEELDEKLHVRSRTDHYASNYDSNWFPIEFFETDHFASITVYISPFIIGFGLISAIGRRRAAIKLLKGGRIKRRGIGRWIGTFKAVAILVTVLVIAVWRVSLSYSIWSRGFEIAPRAFLSFSSDCGGLYAGLIRLDISDVGWKQLIEVDNHWMASLEPKPLLEIEPIEIYLSTIHGRGPLLPSLDMHNNFFRPPCLMGKCPHGNACEVKAATKWDTRLWIPYWLFFLISGFVAIRLIWRDRPWPAGKCRGCGFNIASITTGCCPECGLAFIGQWTNDEADTTALLQSNLI